MHGRHHRRATWKDAVYIIFDHTFYSILLEGYRSVGSQPLIESAYTGSPLPALSGFRFQHQLFCQCFGILLLHHGVNIQFCKILVKIHLVVQILYTGRTAQYKIVCLVRKVHSGIQKITFVSTFVVVGNLVDIFCTIFLSAGFSGIHIWISTLIGVFVVKGEVQFQVFRRQIDSADASSEFVIGVNAFAVVTVFEEPSIVLVKESGRKGKLRRNAVIMCKRCFVVIICGCTEPYICSLISER